MMGILKEFVYGNISPEVQCFKQDSEYGRVMQHLTGIEQKILDRLGADDKAQFEKYIEAQAEVNRLTVVDNLIYGYKLGVTMTAEAFVGTSNLFVGGEGD